MKLLLTLPVLVAWLTGLLLVCLFWLARRSWRDRLGLRAFLALPLGLGVSSCHLFLWLIFFGRAGSGFIFAEVLLVLSLLAALIYRVRKRDAGAGAEDLPAPAPMSRWGRTIAVAFYLALGCAGAIFTALISREPHGQQDAVAMWNTKARIIFRGGAGWTDVLSGYVQHPDYPLMLPLSVARCWAYLGKDLTAAPSLLAGLFTFGIVGLLVSSLSALRGKTQGYLAGLVVLGPFTFITYGISQFADFPLALLLLTTLVLFRLLDRAADERGLLLLAGVAAGLSAWTKNEGLLFLLTVVAARFAVVLPAGGLKAYGRQMRYFACGAIPILLVLLYFKSQAAATDPLVGSRGLGSALGLLTDPSRYLLILGALREQLSDFGGWAPNPVILLTLYMLFVGVRVEGADRRGVLTSMIALFLLSLGYFVVYLITPYDLGWHLSTSLDRLLLQVWPSLVFIYFSIVSTPEEASLEQARGNRSAPQPPPHP